MTDLRHWAEEGATEEELAQLAEARSRRPSSDARKRMLASVGVGAALGVTTTSTAAAGTGILGGFVGKAVLATAVVGALSGAAWQLSERSSGSAQTAPSKPQPVAPAPQRLEPVPVAAELEAAPSEPPASEVTPPLVPEHPPASAVPSPSASLSAEVAALERARRALDSKAPAQALRELEAHRKRFPRAALGAEQAVLTVEALLALGNNARAIEVADRFAAAQPKSPYARRMQDLVRAVRTK